MTRPRRTAPPDDPRARVAPGDADAVRINRYLASAGLGSRRHCEQLVRDSLVEINGRRCDSLSATVHPGDRVSVRGVQVRPRAALHLLLNKPAGIVCTRSDERRRATIYDLLPAEMRHLAHVGRLDRDSEGLLLLTNDGELAQRVSHPKHGCEKEYEVTLDRPFDNPRARERLTAGIRLPEGMARVDRVMPGRDPRSLRIVLRQGWYRQVRRMFEQLGWRVRVLRRIRVGPILLGALPRGRWRRLTPAETRALGGTVSRES